MEDEKSCRVGGVDESNYLLGLDYSFMASLRLGTCTPAGTLKGRGLGVMTYGPGGFGAQSVA